MVKLVERGFFKSPLIKLSDSNIGPGGANNPSVQVLRVGKFNHPKYGEFEITQATLAEMKQNFDNNVRGVDIAFDYFHESDKEASGWPSELYLSDDGNELWSKVDWTPAAQRKLAEREIRYFSPDFAFQWEDPETGKTYKNVLFGGGLTNRPFVKDMAAIVAHEQKGKPMTEEQVKKLEAVLKLAEDGADNMKKMQADQLAMKAHLEKLGAAPAAHPAPVAAAVKPKLADGPEANDNGSEDENDGDDCEDSDDPMVLKKQLAEMKKKLAEYAENAKKLEESKLMAEKTNKFNILLSEGKACAAQKDAFMKGDMDTFIKLSQPLNLEGKGSLANLSEGAGDREDRVLKLADDKCKADPKLKKHDAIVLANKEIK